MAVEGVGVQSSEFKVWSSDSEDRTTIALMGKLEVGSCFNIFKFGKTLCGF